MRCSDAQERLPAYADGVLSPPERARVTAHLGECPACRRQQAALERALDALSALPLEAAPDLWSSFVARAGAGMTCASARKRLAERLDGGLEGLAAAMLEAHLAGCSPCAREAAEWSGALGALERAASASPAPDLWHAFAARLKAERPAAWRSRGAIGAIERLRGLLRGPVLAPALAVAAAAALVFTWRTDILAPEAGSRGRIALAPAPAGAAVRAGAPEAVRAPKTAGPSAPLPPAGPEESAPGRRWGPPPGGRRSGAPRLAVRPAVRPPREAAKPASPPDAPLRIALEPAGRVPSWIGELEVSYNVTPPHRDAAPADPPGAGPAAAEWNTDAAQADLMPEVVHAVALLAGVDDAASHPFEPNPDDP